MRKFTLLLALSISFQITNAQEEAQFRVEVVGTSDSHIVLIPGFSCDGDVWEETVEQLNEDYTCHVLTMAGFSDVPQSSEANWYSWRASISDYIEANKLGQISVIGHSLGGMMALDLASTYPDLIASIVVVDALPSLTALRDVSFQSAESPDCGIMIDMMVNQTTAQFEMQQKANVPSLCMNSSKHDLILSWSMDSDRATLGQLYCELSNLDLRQQIGDVRCPALILLEAPFKMMSSSMEDQYSQLASAELKYAPQGLHFVMYDAPEWYADQLNQFYSL